MERKNCNIIYTLTRRKYIVKFWKRGEKLLKLIHGLG